MDPKHIEEFDSWNPDDPTQAFYDAMRSHLGERKNNTHQPTILLGLSRDTYELKRPLDTFGVHLKGLHSEVKLRFPQSHGVIAHFPDTSHGPGTYKADDPYKGYGGQLKVTDLKIEGDMTRPEISHAVQAFWVVELINTSCWRWSGDGLRVVADVRNPDNHSGANGVFTERLETVYCRGAGVRHQGGDSNVALHMKPDIRYCGDGIVDNSFLGNCWVMPHIAEITKEDGYAILSENPNSRNLFLNPYIEGYPPVKVVPPAIVVGGIGGTYDERTPRMRANTRALEFRGQTEFAPHRPWNEELQEIKTWPVNEASDDAITLLSFSAGRWPLRLKRVRGPHGGTSFVLDHANLGSRKVMEIALDGAATRNGLPLAPGTPGFPLGYTAGPSQVYVTHAPSPDRFPPAAYEKGSQVWNTNPKAGSPLGWVRGEDDNKAAAWLPFGQIG